MQLRNLIVRNFRVLQDIDCELGPSMNVIVGPNAVGKSTVLHAIRLAKSMLAPRIQSEQLQTLISLGAASPHFPQRLFLNGLAHDANRSVEIRCTYSLLNDEVANLRLGISQVVQSVVASRAGRNFTNPAELIQYLESPAGRTATNDTEQEVNLFLGRLTINPVVTLGLHMDCQTGRITSSEPLAGPLIGFLEQSLPPHLTIFSYFPADRALPTGEVQMQIGAGDINQQLESHLSQPQLKYQRLKQTIINALVLNESDRDTIKIEFEKIFGGLLRGRRIHGIGINELGLLSIMTVDIASGRPIELDSLSSGEKNVALTFLLIAKSVFQGGVVLFDEPELHLNPAVCRDVLPFMMDEYSIPRNIQFILCTHSPEILESAFSRNDCTLLQIVSSKNVSKVSRHSLDEYANALQKLGTSVGQSLFHAGTIVVEGVDDIAFLEVAFPIVARKYKLTEKGGRKEVEKTVAKIQELETAGERVSPMYIIHDRDDDVGNLASSNAVKILAWPRYCLENFLIDLDVITELLKDTDVTRSPVANQGEVHSRVKDLAFSQLDELAAREVYKSYGYQNPSLQREDVQGKPLSVITITLYNRMSGARKTLSDIDYDTWSEKFIADCAAKKASLDSLWQANWREICNGKLLMSQLHNASKLKISKQSFKIKIAQRMRDTRSENWRIVRDLLSQGLGITDL